MRGTQVAMVVALTVGIGLRVWISQLNPDYMDDHFEVIEMIRASGELPMQHSAWQGYHPKLFHLTGARCLDLCKKRADFEELRVLNMLNCAIGAATLLLLWGCLKRLKFDDRTRAWLFILACMSPPLVGIAVQATNEALITCLGCALWLTACDYARRPTFPLAVLLSIISALGILTKASGLVLALSAAAALTAWTFCRTGLPRERLTRSVAPALIMVCAGLMLGFAHPYRENRRLYGETLKFNQLRQPAPQWFRESRVPEPGIRSIADGFFTFRLVSLVTEPQTSIPSEWADRFNLAEKHRSSFWSQLYGNSQSTAFWRWPPAWSVRPEWIKYVVIGCNITGLSLVLAFCVGVGVSVSVFTSGMRKGRCQWEFASAFAVFSGLVGIMMVVALAYQYRVYSTFKTTYLLPFAPGLAGIVGVGIEKLSKGYIRWATWVVFLCILCALYLADLGTLIYHLQTLGPIRTLR